MAWCDALHDSKADFNTWADCAIDKEAQYIDARWTFIWYVITRTLTLPVILLVGGWLVGVTSRLDHQRLQAAIGAGLVPAPFSVATPAS